MIRIFQIFLWSWALALCLAALLLGVTGAEMEVGAFFVVISFFPSLVIVLLTAQTVRAIKRRRVAAVMSYLEQAVRLNLPLPRMLHAAANSEKGVLASRLSHLRLALQTGAGLSDALRVELPETPPRTIALIAAGERTGRLPQVLERLLREARSRDLGDPSEGTFIVAYPIILTLTIGMIISVIMIFVMPKFEQIFKDFKVDLPLITQWLLSVSRAVGEWILPIMLVIVMLFVGGILIEFFSRPPHGRRWSWLTGWFTRNRDLADACRVIADSLEAGLAMDAALLEASALPLGSGIRHGLYAWAGGIDRGLPMAEAAQIAGMPKLVIGLAATSEITAAREGFAFLARYYANLFSRVEQLARGAAIPAVVLFFAVIVGWVAVSLFAPMVALIQALSGGYQHL